MTSAADDNVKVHSGRYYGIDSFSHSLKQEEQFKTEYIYIYLNNNGGGASYAARQ